MAHLTQRTASLKRGALFSLMFFVCSCQSLLTAHKKQTNPASSRSIAKSRVVFRLLSKSDIEKLKKGKIKNADYVDFLSMYLKNVNLEGVSLRGANFQWANLEKADLTRADLTGAYLRGAKLRWAVLERTIFTDADLRWVDFRRAYLLGAILIGAVLYRADLRWADLRKADLTGADFSGVIYNDKTRFPFGFDKSRLSE